MKVVTGEMISIVVSRLAMMCEEFDRSLDDDMKEVRFVAFLNQDNALGKPLEKRRFHQRRKVRLAHAHKKRKCADEFEIVVSHRATLDQIGAVLN
jgi:hypothetical protein